LLSLYFEITGFIETPLPARIKPKRPLATGIPSLPFRFPVQSGTFYPGDTKSTDGDIPPARPCPRARMDSLHDETGKNAPLLATFP
jgi:hypothetical protein